jgi:FeS assembly SUF system protein
MGQDFENFDSKPPQDDRMVAPEVGEQPKPTPQPDSALSQEELDRLSADIIAALKTVHDPEIPADIYELGLIYKVDVDDDRNVTVDMTLTTAGCPVAGEMPIWVENAVSSVEGVKHVEVNLTFNPPWDMSRMSEEARIALGMF